MDIEDVNKRFAKISRGNKEFVVEFFGPDDPPEKRGGIKKYWRLCDFKEHLCKEKIIIGQPNRNGVTPLGPLADHWLKHRRGRAYDELVFDMPGSAIRAKPNDYNGWLGFTVKPKSGGSWEHNKAHILNIICDKNQSVFKWVINWCADLLQFPGKHGMSAIVLSGAQGTGKGHFAHVMLGLMFYEQQYMHLNGANQLTGRFNGHLSGKSYLFADEATWGGDLAAADALKSIITEDTINIEEKFVPMVSEPSSAHVIIASNNDWPVNIQKADRRFVVLNVSEAQRQHDGYFTTLRRELHDGGRAAMLHDLLCYSIDESLLRHPIMTDGKRVQMMRSLSPIQRWWCERLHEGIVKFTHWPDDPTKGLEISKAFVHQDYVAFLTQHYPADRKMRETETTLGMFLRKHITNLGDGRTTEGRYWRLPPLAVCRADWAAAFDWPSDYDWDDKYDKAGKKRVQPSLLSELTH